MHACPLELHPSLSQDMPWDYVEMTIFFNIFILFQGGERHYKTKTMKCLTNEQNTMTRIKA